MPRLNIDDKKKYKYKTVGEMLEYIYTNNIPMDSLVLVEQLKDYYLEDKETKSWDYYECQGDYPRTTDKLIPAHNGFGSCFNKKAFVIWMHY